MAPRRVKIDKSVLRVASAPLYATFEKAGRMTLAWHFVGDTLRYGEPIPADGKLLHHTGSVVICRSGLHASERIIDALTYAPGNIICRVECDDIIDEQRDKLVCRERTILWRVDGEELLREFARKCALDVIHLWDAPQVVIPYLQTGDPELQDAARATAEAARATAEAAAWDAAARDAAAAASAAAAARAAAEAARDAARDAQNTRLEQMVQAAHEEAV